MMKIRTMFRGRRTVILGLSHNNLDRLRADGLEGHMKIDGTELGIDFDILITAAVDERAMIEAFADGITGGTKVRIDKRFKS